MGASIVPPDTKPEDIGRYSGGRILRDCGRGLEVETRLGLWYKGAVRDDPATPRSIPSTASALRQHLRRK